MSLEHQPEHVSMTGYAFYLWGCQQADLVACIPRVNSRSVSPPALGANSRFGVGMRVAGWQGFEPH